jgi:predicted RND superfamily exporter protein
MNIDDGDTYLAVRGTYNMIGKSIEKNEIDFLFEWENEWERNLFDNDLSTSKNFKLYMQSNNDLNEGLSSAVSSDMGLILVGVFLSIIYLSIAIGMACDTVQSRVLLGLAAISSIILAIISTYGVGSLLTFYGPVHQALPLLMIAIGVDDAFVIVSSYDQHEVVNHDDKRFTEALHSAGSAIAFTSVTNACGYLVASVTEIAALRNFTVWAAIGKLFAKSI